MTNTTPPIHAAVEIGIEALDLVVGGARIVVLHDTRTAEQSQRSTDTVADAG